MITFTFAENLTDLDLANRVWETFVNRYRKLVPYDFRIRNSRHVVHDFEYVCIPEFQSRGAVHFHVMVHGAHCQRRVRAEWMAAQRLCGIENPGNQVNLKYFRAHKDRHRAIGYATKYIVKNFEAGEQFRKRYYRSKGIPAPTRERYFTMEDLFEDDVRSLIEGEYCAKVVFVVQKKVGPFDMFIGRFVPW